MIRAIAALLCVLPATGRADAWDVFTARCVEPMSNFAAADVIGLTPGGATMAGEHFDAHRLAVMRTFAVTPDTTLVLQSGDHTHTMNCLVLTDDDTAGSQRSAADLWLTDAVEAGSWEFASDGFLGPEYLSTTWREPKLRFTLIDPPRDPRIIFGLSETDLES